MNIADYQEAAAVTMRADQTRDEALTNFLLGLFGESGEVVDELKKVLFHGKEIDRGVITRELGDVLWYVSAIATTLGIALEDVLDKNIEKLRARHGGGRFVEHGEQRR